MKSDRVKLLIENEAIKESFVSWNEKCGINLEIKFSEKLSKVDKQILIGCIVNDLIDNNVLEYFNEKFKEVKFINLIEI